ncbi:23185_t:CDS:1, partial [Gigaspora rosea]
FTETDFFDFDIIAPKTYSLFRDVINKQNDTEIEITLDNTIESKPESSHQTHPATLS